MKTLQVRNMPKSGQAGFTIIELIVVILLLGILTATALPRFLDVTDEAHAAVVDAVRGGLNTGTALFRAQFVAGGEDTTVVVPNFGTNYANSAGYPMGNDTTDSTIDSHAECLSIYQGLLQQGRPPAVVSTGTEPGAIVAANTQGAAAGAGDFLAHLTANNTCTYAYVGQYTATADGTIPTLVYSSSGSISTGSL
jgi:MSHA pilin protein MshB